MALIFGTEKWGQFFWRMLFRKVLGGDFELTEGDGAVVALDKNVVFRDESFALGRAGGAVERDIFLDKDVVEVDGEEAGLFEKGAVFFEAGSAELYEQFLPLTGGLCGVDEGGVAFVALGLSFVVPAVVDRSHVAIGHFRFAVAVEDLDLVAALKIDAGVGSFGDEELGLDGAVTEFSKSLEVACFFRSGSVGEEEGFS